MKIQLLVIVTLILVFAIPYLAVCWWVFARANRMLERWAAQNGYQILERRLRMLWRGPFIWTSSGGQVVYRVHVCDAQSNERFGWALCGGFFGGVLSDEVEIEWDKNQVT